MGGERICRSGRCRQPACLQCVPLGQTAFTSIVVGSDVAAQAGDLNVDDVVIKTVP